jgi:hypothetical protein
MLIPDVYEADYQNMLWYQQHYSHTFGRHWNKTLAAFLPPFCLFSCGH